MSASSRGCQRIPAAICDSCWPLLTPNTVMQTSYTNWRAIEKLHATDDQYTVGYHSTLLSKNHLHSVSSQIICLHNLQPSYSYKLSLSSYTSQVSLFTIFAHWKTVLIPENQSENVTYRQNKACSCFKLQSKQTYGIRQIQFNSLVWGLLRLAPLMLSIFFWRLNRVHCEEVWAVEWCTWSHSQSPTQTLWWNWRGN